MKIRNGFVSNSSSSSFMIAIAKDRAPSIKVEINLEPMIEFRIEDEEDILRYYQEELGYATIEEFLEDGTEWERKRHKAILKALKEGKIIHVGKVSSDSEHPEVQYIYQNGLDAGDRVDDFDVIQGVNE